MTAAERPPHPSFRQDRLHDRQSKAVTRSNNSLAVLRQMYDLGARYMTTDPRSRHRIGPIGRN